jgi:hypothetical protein
LLGSQRFEWVDVFDYFPKWLNFIKHILEKWK